MSKSEQTPEREDEKRRRERQSTEVVVSQYIRELYQQHRPERIAYRTPPS
jgi:hypothetical protein